MPVVTVDWWKGNGRSQRAELVAELTSSVARIAGCPQEAVTVIVRDVDPGYWGKGGVMADTLVSGSSPEDTEHPETVENADGPGDAFAAAVAGAASTAASGATP
ncbi:4-oxalocrotonate tautomerase [Streptomyces sp. 150FB]|uniref:tautomerase family protein n=1 Tax=Streptomyces sp. 150FB TaxID=1576605 RepID=UPI000588F541|nr:4-oxalocrotonate tautomerase family protein [Streptomyces sp. 150FB]KIF76498.1 4-oxalocrotonate tautomerase [Streptomyces sp. 150FB]